MSLKKKKRGADGPQRAKIARSAGAAIVDVLKLHHIDETVRSQRIITDWNDLVGERIAAKTRPIGITERMLVIEVVSSPWMQELALMKPQILLGLFERVGNPRLFDDVKFRLTGRSRPETLPPRPLPRRAPQPRPVGMPAIGADRAAIERDVEGVEDPELRELIARVRITHDR